MHDEHSSNKFWIKITVSCLSYEVGLHGKTKFSRKSGIFWKLDTFHTASKTASFERVIFIMKVLPWNWLKCCGSVLKRKDCCTYFSHPLDIYETSTGRNLWTSRHFCRKLSGKLPQAFCKSLKKIKDWKLPSASMTSNTMFRSIMYFLWNNYPLWSKFYDLLLFPPLP